MGNIRTDLAIEAHEMCSKNKAENNHYNGIDVNEFENNGIFITEIKINTEEGAKILSKPIGTYVTIEAPDLKFSEEAYVNACRELAKQLKNMHDISDKTKTLVVGLGNKHITPDALGPEVVSKLMITNHLKNNSLIRYYLAANHT